MDGKVTIDPNDPTIVLGKQTSFTEHVHIGQYIVIKNEKKPVLKVFSDIAPEIGGGFRSSLGANISNTVEGKTTP